MTDMVRKSKTILSFSIGWVLRFRWPSLWLLSSLKISQTTNCPADTTAVIRQFRQKELQADMRDTQNITMLNI